MEDKIYFSVTSYLGFEQEVLKVLNRNRSNVHTRQYLDWRYLGENSPHPPIIFWLHMLNGQRVGMASLISRPYWMGDEAARIWVLGDISLDKGLRGKGLGRKLFQFMNSFLEKEFCKGVFVIPNVAAQKTLTQTGWSQPYPFAWFILAIDPVATYFPHLICNPVLVQFSKVWRQLIMKWFSLHCSNQFQLEKIDSFDTSFDDFWHVLEKDGLIIRDRSLVSLRWRFEQHPHHTYQIEAVKVHNKMVGYIVYEINKKGMCRITDILALSVRFVRPMIALFLKKILKQKEIRTLRIKLNNNHLYCNQLKKLGFIKRIEKDVFQVYDPHNIGLLKSKWFITVADKDT
ncbi:MAG: GNAT family N-acetyltransferase [Parachlamydiaceae bacterium]|nr:GNAT family N-acetyltransferase [Parachlamydiaceae bacterium]